MRTENTWTARRIYNEVLWPHAEPEGSEKKIRRFKTKDLHAFVSKQTGLDIRETGKLVGILLKQDRWIIKLPTPNVIDLRLIMAPRNENGGESAREASSAPALNGQGPGLSSVFKTLRHNGSKIASGPYAEKIGVHNPLRYLRGKNPNASDDLFLARILELERQKALKILGGTPERPTYICLLQDAFEGREEPESGSPVQNPDSSDFSAAESPISAPAETRAPNARTEVPKEIRESERVHVIRAIFVTAEEAAVLLEASGEQEIKRLGQRLGRQAHLIKILRETKILTLVGVTRAAVWILDRDQLNATEFRRQTEPLRIRLISLWRQPNGWIDDLRKIAERMPEAPESVPESVPAADKPALPEQAKPVGSEDQTIDRRTSRQALRVRIEQLEAAQKEKAASLEALKLCQHEYLSRIRAMGPLIEELMEREKQLMELTPLAIEPNIRLSSSVFSEQRDKLTEACESLRKGIAEEEANLKKVESELLSVRAEESRLSDLAGEYEKLMSELKGLLV